MGGFFLGIKVSTNPAYSLSAGMRDLHDDEGRVAVEAAEGHASGTGMLRQEGGPARTAVNAVFWQPLWVHSKMSCSCRPGPVANRAERTHAARGLHGKGSASDRDDSTWARPWARASTACP